MHLELDSIDAVSAHLDHGRPLSNAVIQGLDLRGLEALGRVASFEGAVFLGCRLDPAVQERAVATGALLFPALPSLPFEPYRARLYTVDELMAGYDPAVPSSFDERSRDGLIHAWSKAHPAGASVLDALACRLHDHAIDDALQDLLGVGEGARRVVAIMGGHGLGRDTAAYADVARMAAALAREGYLLTSGGGPGAMEATHLGAWFCRAPELLERALDLVATAPSYTDARWFETAYAARALAPCGAESLAIPTWFYGHEPTNLFASHVAKYFSNSLREDGLLMIARHGVIYARGAAGTVQEIFMDACQNHYVTTGVVSPMVLFDADYWRTTLPAEPLLRALSGSRPYARAIHATSDPDDAVRFVVQHPPFTP
ncbi:MAG: hypothetical protein IT385_05030 [Deltaproteobacteria bacterium]|nr:hypothetical protein [Deltaproteobacteria bacterium]